MLMFTQPKGQKRTKTLFLGQNLFQHMYNQKKKSNGRTVRGGGVWPIPKFPYQKKLGHSELLRGGGGGGSEFRSFSEKNQYFFFMPPLMGQNLFLETKIEKK